MEYEHNYGYFEIASATKVSLYNEYQSDPQNQGSRIPLIHKPHRFQSGYEATFCFDRTFFQKFRNIGTFSNVRSWEHLNILKIIERNKIAKLCRDWAKK